MEKYIEIGRFTSPHSFRGEAKLECWVDSPDDLLGLKSVFLVSGGEYRPFAVGSIRKHNAVLLVKLEGINDDEGAKTLSGRTVYALRSDFVLEEGRFFVSDLIGARVYDADGGKEYGKLTDVLKYAANDVYEVTSESGKKTLIPAVKEFVKSVDPESGIAISPIGGMFDDED